MPRERREQLILDVAGQVFAQAGYESAPMDEIASLAGVSKPMLYAYFGSKEGLFLACLDKADQRLRAAVRDAVHGADGAEQRLWRGFVALFRFFEEDRDVWALGYRAGPGAPSFAAAAARSRQAMVELLTEVFVDTAVQAGVDPDVARESEPLAHALTGAAVALVSWAGDRPDEPSELHALRLMNFAWMGLGNLVRGELWVPPTEEEQK
jgi:AcrR family transcriptional regulator